MTSETFLDPVALEKLHDLGGQKFVGDMIGLFLDFAPKKIAEARVAGQAGDWLGVEKAVHPLKSCAAGVGAVALQALAVSIERLAKEKNAETIPALLLDLEAAAARVRPLLEAEQKKRAE